MSADTSETAAASPSPTLDPEVWRALGHGHVIDITTIGRRSGEPRRIEITFFNFGGRLFISGMPNPNRERAWLINIRANPNITFHLKEPVTADLAATAHEVTDPDQVREVQTKVARAWQRDAEEMIRSSPLIEIVIPGYGVADSEHPAATQD